MNNLLANTKILNYLFLCKNLKLDTRWQSVIWISDRYKNLKNGMNNHYTQLIKGKIEINAPNRPLNHFICISNKEHLSLCSAKHRPLKMDLILYLTSSPCNVIGIDGRVKSSINCSNKQFPST